MKYVSIDIETTGMDPKYHQTIEFGAVIEDTENPLPLCELPRFRALIKHDDYNINPYCLRLHAKLLDELTEKQKKNPKTWFDKWVDGSIVCMPDALCHLFQGWLKDNGIDTDISKVIVAGKNFHGFDIGFIEELFKGRVKFHHRVLDPVTLFTQPTDEEPPNLGKCAKRAGIEFKGTYHTAIADAIMVIELLRAGWKQLRLLDEIVMEAAR